MYLNECILPISSHHGLHKLVNKVVIFLTRDPFMVQSNVIGVIEQGLSICAHVQHNWETLTWFNSSQGGVQTQFSDRNSHPVRAQVAKS